MVKKIRLKDKKGFSGSYFIRVYRAGTRELLREAGPFHNLVVSSSGGYGRNLVCRALAGDNTYGIAITNGKIGTGTTPPADGDTDIETAVLSTIPVASYSISNDILVMSFFMANAELPDGTYSEFTMHIGARLFARSLISPAHTKATGEDTVVDYSIDLSP